MFDPRLAAAVFSCIAEQAAAQETGHKKAFGHLAGGVVSPFV
jgi:hypothetical protein